MRALPYEDGVLGERIAPFYIVESAICNQGHYTCSACECRPGGFTLDPTPLRRGARGEGHERRYLVYRCNIDGRRIAVLWRATHNWGQADFERNRETARMFTPVEA